MGRTGWDEWTKRWKTTGRSRRFFEVSVRLELCVSSSYLVKNSKSRGGLLRGGGDAVPQLERDRLFVGSTEYVVWRLIREEGRAAAHWSDTGQGACVTHAAVCERT